MKTIYISTQGNDAWSGLLPDPNANGTDGPLATPLAARNRIRHLSQPPAYHTANNADWQPQGIEQPIFVLLRGGVYSLQKPLSFSPADAGPIEFSSYPGETAILDGGQRLEGWVPGEVHGRPCWILDLPEVARGEWYFRSLFVNGQRRPRPNLPKSDWFWIEDVPGKGLSAEFHEGSSCFVAREGDIRDWKNLTEVEVVVLHYWNDEHMNIISFDESTRLVRCDRRSILRLTDDSEPRFAKYYVQNVFEALSEPGEWYLDRPTGRLYYLPVEGETPENSEVYAPRLTRLLQVAGDPDSGRLVEGLHFSGLTFRHTDAPLPPGGWDPVACDSLDGLRHWPNDTDYASAPQAAFNIPGVIQFEAARNCGLEGCLIEHVGWTAVEIGDASTSIRIVGNEMRDLGGGGIKISGADVEEPRIQRSGYHLITDNHIHHAGRVFHQAVGILIRHSFGNRIAHNHIHDLFYTGISCGWKWGFMETVCRDNLIEHNHIHHLGFGHLCDMGGIYTLGVQPGTVLRGNLIHDVRCANYGGWGIYLDEGSSHILVENNVVHDTQSEGFFQHYGRENLVRNNIFAAGIRAQVALGKAATGFRGFNFFNNIVVSEGSPIHGTYNGDLLQPAFASDHNLFWCSGDAGVFHCTDAQGESRVDTEALRAAGLECHSLVADPIFANFSSRDLRLAPNSPALGLGIIPIDLSTVGCRSAQK